MESGESNTNESNTNESNFKKQNNSNFNVTVITKLNKRELFKLYPIIDCYMI